MRSATRIVGVGAARGSPRRRRGGAAPRAVLHVLLHVLWDSRAHAMPVKYRAKYIRCASREPRTGRAIGRGLPGRRGGTASRVSAHDPGPGEEPVDDASTNLEFGRLGKHRTPLHSWRAVRHGREARQQALPPGRAESVRSGGDGGDDGDERRRVRPGRTRCWHRRLHHRHGVTERFRRRRPKAA